MKKITIVLLMLASSFLATAQISWYAQDPGTNNLLLDVSFVNPDEGWVCGNTGMILYTGDGGYSWTELDAPPNNTYYGIHFTDSQNGFACGYAGNVIITNDGGQTWDMHSPGSSAYLYDIFFLNADTGWAVGGDNGVFPSYIKQREVVYTEDGGQSWNTQINVSADLLKSVHFSSFDNGFAVGNSGTILFTSDGGQNWDEVMSDNSYHFYDVFTTHAGTAHVVGYYLGLPHAPVVFKTEDSGNTWTSQSLDEEDDLSSIFFIDEDQGWIAGGRNNDTAVIYRTTDGGQTWLKENPGTGSHLFSIFFVGDEAGWAVGASGTILASTVATDVEEPAAEENFRIYPNPASSIINIQSDIAWGTNTRISLHDISGRTVYQQGNTNFNETATLRLPVNDLPGGLYFIRIDNGQDQSIQRVMISR